MLLMGLCASFQSSEHFRRDIQRISQTIQAIQDKLHILDDLLIIELSERDRRNKVHQYKAVGSELAAEKPRICGKH